MTKTLTPTTQIYSLNRTNSHGFTLIEIMIVIALITLVMSTVVSRVSLTLRVTMDGTSRDLATTIKTAFDEANLKGRVYRMVFDMDKNQYWVEQGPKKLMLITERQKEDDARLDSRRNEEERKKIQKPVFSEAKDVLRKKITLPSGLSFSDISSSQSKEPIKGGTVYAHIYPHGFMEKLTIHMKDTSDHESTLFVDPVSGKSRVFGVYMQDHEKR